MDPRKLLRGVLRKYGLVGLPAAGVAGGAIGSDGPAFGSLDGSM